MTTRVYKVTHRGDDQGALTKYYMTYSAAVLALTEAGYELRRDANPDANETAWATRNGIFGAEDAWIGWLDAEGRCPACEAAELAQEAR